MEKHTIPILGVPVYILNSSQIIEKINSFLQKDKHHFIITANSLMLNQVSQDKNLKECFSKADLVIPESVGVVWAIQFLKKIKDIERTPGIDLLWRILNIAEEKGYKVYLLGSKQSVIEEAVKNIKKKLKNIIIVGYHNGYFTLKEEKHIISDINNKKTDILFVGMNATQQERWIYEHLNMFKTKLCMGVGGSFDVISGRLKRAPLWMRNLGLEWFFRFLQQPWRIKRVIRLPEFVIRVILETVYRR